MKMEANQKNDVQMNKAEKKKEKKIILSFLMVNSLLSSSLYI